MNKTLEAVTEAATSQYVNRQKSNINNETGPISHNYRCSKAMTDLINGFDQACQKEVSQWKSQDVTSNSTLVQRLLGLRQLRPAQKTALIIHFEIFGSDDALAKTITQVTNEIGKSVSDYATFQITGRLLNDQISSQKLIPPDEALKAIYSWVNAQETPSKSDISVEYLLITDAGVRDLDSENNQKLLKTFTVPLRSYLRAAVYTTQLEEDVRALMTSILDLEVEVTENLDEVLRQYVDEKRSLYQSIRAAQATSDDLLYSELIMQHSANTDALGRITEQVLFSLKDRGLAEQSKRIYELYVGEIKHKLGFFELEEQDFLNRLARQKLAVQEVANAACEERVKSTDSRIYLKKAVIQMKIEGANIRTEVDKIKYSVAKQMDEIGKTGGN